MRSLREGAATDTHDAGRAPSFPEASATATDDSAIDDVRRLVLYYDVFHHPLTVPELACLLGAPTPTIEGAVATATRRGLVARTAGFVHAPDRDTGVDRRRTRARAAERLWPAAYRAAATLARFPYVRGVMVTGGLSKNSIGADSDVDFLLLVEPGRVWLTKSITQVWRRSLPDRVRACFCTNYILAADRLEIAERTMFTAIELATAVPLYGPEVCGELLERNTWGRQFVPGWDHAVHRAYHAAPLPRRRATALIERTVAPGADRLDEASRGGWTRFWDRKYDWVAVDRRRVRFRRERHIATNHLNDFHGWVLGEWEDRLRTAGLLQT